MFYSHEVLTSRKYGVATVWLVATLGSKSTLKKVHKKDILEVDVPKACSTIIDPEAPLALRLQGNLLFGLSRVYEQKCGYLLVDAENARATIRGLMSSITSNTIKDSRNHVAKRDHITLTDDPNFILESALLPDAFEQDIDLGSIHDSALISLHSGLDSAASADAYSPSVQGIIIPPSASSVSGQAQGFGPERASTVSSQRDRFRDRFGSGMYDRDEDIGVVIDDPGFAFDVEGNYFETAAGAPGSALNSGRAQSQPEREGSAAYDQRGSRQDYLDAMALLENDEPLPTFHENYLYQDVRAFSPRPEVGEEALPPDEDVGMEDVAVAEERRTRKRKAIPLDTTLELHNRDLAAWHDEYISNMQRNMNSKQHERSTALARSNADFWVLGNGINGLGRIIGPERLPTQLQMFTGARLFEAITGHRLNDTPSKRRLGDRDAGGDDESERRVRARMEGDEVGRAAPESDAPAADMEDYGPIHYSDTIEIGREAGTPLADQASATMPWNISASRRGSSARLQGPTNFSASRAGAGTSSIGGGGVLASLGRRPSSVLSPTPLTRRQTALGDTTGLGLEDFQLPPDTGSDDAEGDALPMATQEREEFQTFGVSAAVDTQMADTPAWIRRALDGESVNFLEFVKAFVEERRGRTDGAQVEDEVEEGVVEFETLLPTESNSRIVAAQGLLHVLALATRGLLRARQTEHFGAIGLVVL